MKTGRTQNASEDLERIWDLESIGIQNPSFESAREEKQTSEDSAVTHFESTCTRLDDGRYQVRWPKKDNFSCLPDGDRLARARLERCEKALERSGRRPEYEKAIMQYMEDGYAELVPCTPDGPLYVMSHHAVYKNGKIRIVLDASAGHPQSLNDCVLAGPNLIADLDGILLRFRLHPVAVSADIEKAFLQISLHPEERDVTRFLWRENPGEEPTVFRMTRVVFGVSASPFLLQATIKRHLSLYAESLPGSVLRLGSDLYCDDLLTSLKTEEEAENFIQETKQIFSDAKMNMRKWTSNRKLEAVENDGPKAVRLPDGGAEERKMLGVVWAPADDTLRFDPSCLVIMGDNMRPTKRNLLRISARIFDPLGLLTPFTVRTKMLLKQLWIRGKGWDDPMPDDLQKLWLVWNEELKQLEKIRIPRTYDSDDIDSFEIHTFCDASQEAYAAAVYLRPNGEHPRQSRLMISKSRLAPTKPMCLARLELMAAVIGARLTEYVLRSVSLQPDSVRLWTDSAVALAWIRSNPRRWGTFVSNRVVEVQQKFPPECWRHCPGESNPADLPSRGCSVKKMQKDLWQIEIANELSLEPPSRGDGVSPSGEPSAPYSTHPPTTNEGRTSHRDPEGFFEAGRGLAHLASLLLRAGDVEENPGPAAYPCGKCGRNVGSSSVLCQLCKKWHHSRCAGLRPADLRRMVRGGTTWTCPRCGSPPGAAAASGGTAARPGSPPGAGPPPPPGSLAVAAGRRVTTTSPPPGSPAAGTGGEEERHLTKNQRHRRPRRRAARHNQRHPPGL